MTPEPITRLNAALEGRYRIEREIGEGGMATVYLAEDLRHERKVALKVLKPELAAVVGAERFLAEIKTTANLQHPHILPLFESGEADGFLFYAMPFVEGESLLERLDREHQLPVDEAVAIATKVAGALQAAHERGVIHRDIKPANILLSKGEPLVSDFGIALAVGAAGGGRLTETGLSLGTPHYMSPEQATGDQNIGPQTDTYALGCVLYETLVGEPPYTGPNAQAVLGRIITAEPVSAAKNRTAVPPNVDATIRKALEKLPADRFSRASDFARALADPGFRHGEDLTAAVGRGESLRKRVALAATVVALGAMLWMVSSDEPPRRVTRFIVATGEGQALDIRGAAEPRVLDIAPDGSRFVYVGSSTGMDESRRLFLRSMDDLEAQPLAGTEGALAPAISPDGSRVAFLRGGDRPGGSLRVMPLDGGTSVVLTEDDLRLSAPAWGSNDHIYFLVQAAQGGTRLMRVRASGGDSEVVLEPDLGPEYVDFIEPFIISETQVLLTAVRIDGGREVHLFDLSRGVSTYLVSGQAGRVTASGHFLYVNEAGALMGQRLQAGEAVTSGEPAMLLQGVGQRGGGVDIAISSEGTLLYTGPTRSEPERWMWVARDGTLEPFDPSWTDGEFEGLALSPDGTRLAVEMSREGRYDIWIKAVEGGPPSRLTFEGVRNGSPAWTPDGGRVGYVSWTDPAAASVAIASQGDIWVRPADGSGVPELGLDSQHGVVDFQWSADGSWLLATVVEPNPNIIAVRVGSDEEPRLLLGSAAEEFNPALSPDSRWLAYVSDESGRDEVYVVPFPDVSAGKWQISSGGAVNPLWSRDGSELFMRPTERRGMDVADMRRGPAGTTAAPLFELPPDRFFESGNLVPMVDVARDGRFIMDQAGQGDRPGDLILVQNFFEELRRMVP